MRAPRVLKLFPRESPRSWLASRFAACLMLLAWSTATAQAADELPYTDDPALVRQFEVLGPRGSLLLPPVAVHCGDLKMHGMERYGPGQRDYCNKMVYAPDRKAALYAGGNHQVPHRMNDVWEYHLGSNSWHLLYGPDGGNPGIHKGAYFLTSRTLVQNPNKELTAKEREQLAAYGAWWKEHVELRDGHLVTKQGGPIMPAHTWDAFTYDARARRLLWGMGASPASQLSTHAYYTGRPEEELTGEIDGTYSPMWMFDPAERRWIHYRTSVPRAELRGMGATMAYLPDLHRTLWYVAAENVAPAAYEMWQFDAVADEWTELKPNGGKSIAELVRKEQVAPGAELQTAYSPKHRKLVAVLKHETFVYDVAANTWAKIDTDARIWGHDAHSVLAYDDHCDAFLLAFPPEGRGKQLSLAAFSFARGKWELIEPNGPPLPTIQFGGYMGYFDPSHGLFAVQGRYSDRMWVYRHGEE